MQFLVGDLGKEVEKSVTLSANCPIIGADGGPSAVRYALRDAGHIKFSEEILPQGYKEMIFPVGEGGEYDVCVFIGESGAYEASGFVGEGGAYEACGFDATTLSGEDVEMGGTGRD